MSEVRLTVALLCFSLFSLACEPEPPVAAAEPAAAATATPFDLAGYCAAMCKRTTTCGLQAAEAPAARGGEGTAKALAEAKAGAAELERSCLAGCKWKPVDEADKSAALRAERCLDEKDCAALESCLGEI